MNLRPLKDRVLVGEIMQYRQLQDHPLLNGMEEDRHENPFPKHYNEPLCRGKILTVGSGVDYLSEGDVVCFLMYSGEDFGDNQYRVLRANSVIGFVE